MKDEYSDPRDKFINLIDTEKCRAIFEPHLVFVCGGRVDPKVTNNHSIRNMFMNLSAAIGASNVHDFILAENFKDWKDGYKSLSDFENDIAQISSFVIVFLESEGALAEFGLFFANEQLRKKLVAVLNRQHYDSESFIKFGLLNPLQELNQRLVLAYEIDHKNIENVRKDEVEDIVHHISEHCNDTRKSEQFDLSNRGHAIFMAFQIIDLLLALTKSEILKYLKLIGISLSPQKLDSALFILQKFQLVGSRRRSSQNYYFALKRRTARIDLHFKKEGLRRFDSSAIKIEVSEFYKEHIEQDSNFRNRVKVIESIFSDGDEA